MQTKMMTTTPHPLAARPLSLACREKRHFLTLRLETHAHKQNIWSFFTENKKMFRSVNVVVNLTSGWSHIKPAFRKVNNKTFNSPTVGTRHLYSISIGLKPVPIMQLHISVPFVYTLLKLGD